MEPFQTLSAVEQLAEYLLEQIQRGKITGHMPGIDKLSQSLGCSPRTTIGALKQLEHEGVLIHQGAGRPSLINQQIGKTKYGLRIQILLYEEMEIESRYHIQILNHLSSSGHSAAFSSKTLHDLGMDVKRVANHVSKIEADAWVVTAAPRNILEWFSSQSMPAFALFGRRRGLPIAGVGPKKEEAYAELARHLIQLGHKRIVLVSRPERRNPAPGLPERCFLEELDRNGIKTGNFNLPDWDGTSKHLPILMDTMFRYTPPTALIMDEVSSFLAVQSHLARNGILAPQHVSLICGDYDPYLEFMEPSIAHIECATEPWARAVSNWANLVARGRNPRRQLLTKFNLFLDGTVGPPPED